MTTRRKILLYSHDSFGLGNIRRTLALAGRLAAEHPEAAVLIATGSPVVHSFRIPPRVDYVKLPSLDRVAAERYAPRFLDNWSREVRAMRTAMLTRIVSGFEPDLFIVDKRPAGIDGELLGTLESLRQSGAPTRLVVGIRDILDAPERTRPALARSRFEETIERYYDEIWIYGARDVFDPVRAYGLSPAVARKVRFTGYLGRAAPACAPAAGPPRVVVTTGGGGDGSQMIAAFLDGLATLPRRIALRSTVILGPEMPPDRRAALLARHGHLADVEFVDFEPDPLPRLAAAAVVVSMAGYNTVCEVLSAGRPAILVPRSVPVLEQLIRARCFARRGWVDMVEPRELTPGRLIRAVLRALEQPARPRPAIDLAGLARVTERAAALLDAA